MARASGLPLLNNTSRHTVAKSKLKTTTAQYLRSACHCIDQRNTMKKGLVIVWIAVIFSGIGLVFWYQDWKYKTPTPVPTGYKMVNIGTKLTLPFGNAGNKPMFLHFFNPKCPCSRFNMTHFKSLVKQYGKLIDFTIVVMSDTEYSVAEIQQKFGLSIPVRFDQGVAETCGVYSTPQAVVIDTDQRLFYRGNYNKSRYCSEKRTEYARMALDALLRQEKISFELFALKAYGCKLPNCTKN
jgi:hypothetical protein